MAKGKIRFAARREMLRVHGVSDAMTVEHSEAILHGVTETEKKEAEESLKRIAAYEGDEESENLLLAEKVGEE